MDQQLLYLETPSPVDVFRHLSNKYLWLDHYVMIETLSEFIEYRWYNEIVA
jgi:hypothetical protein